MADRPPRGRDREASRPFAQATPRRRSKSTKARDNVPDLRDILEDKAKHTRSIYGSRGRPMIRDDNRRTGHSKSGRTEHSRQSSLELRCDIAQYRGTAHPLCFTDEVMDHQIPEGFKLVNIESYDGTTDPAVWIEAYLLHIHMAQQTPRFGSKTISFTSTWPAVMIFTPSNTSHSSLKDQLDIGLTACQQSQLVARRTWKSHSLTISRAPM